MKIAERESIIRLLKRRAQDPGGGIEPSGNKRVIWCRHLREPTVGRADEADGAILPRSHSPVEKQELGQRSGPSSQQGVAASLTVWVHRAVELETLAYYTVYGNSAERHDKRKKKGRGGGV